MDDNYKKIRSCTVGTAAYWLISPAGDGNCGLYAFACALIDAITTHKLSLNADLFNHFKNTLLKNSPCSKLKECLDNPLSCFEHFKAFLLQNPEPDTLKKLTQELSNTLRQIGYANYIELLKKEMNVEHIEITDQMLNQDKIHIGFEILVSLATYFKLNVGLLAYNANTKQHYWAYAPDNSQPTFLLINLNAHWNYLLPKKQTNGLSKFLLNASISASKRSSTKIKKFIIQFTYNATKAKRMIQNLKRYFIAHEVISNEENQKNLTSFYKNLSMDVDLRVNEPTMTIVETLHNLEPEKFTILLNKQALKEIEKDLVTKTYVIDSKTDNLAIKLQNATALNFFEESYSLIYKKKSTRLSLFKSNTNHTSTEKKAYGSALKL